MSTPCGAGIPGATPLPIFNPPGRENASYRIGTHAEFKSALLAGLSSADAGPLRALQTRETDDFTIALLDAWATSLDVLTFYQERLANEAFLRTATERRAILEHSRLIGYEPRPGIAAEATLAFTLETAPGAPESLILEPGIKVQSIPAPGEQSVTFETSERMEVRPAWNSLRPTFYDPVPAPSSADSFAHLSHSFWVSGTTSGLKVGDALLVSDSVLNSTGTRESWVCLKRIIEIALYPDGNTTHITTENISGFEQLADTDTTTFHGYHLRGFSLIGFKSRVAPFGHNAPRQPVAASPSAPLTSNEWTTPNAPDPFYTSLDLDGIYASIHEDRMLLVQNTRAVHSQGGTVVRPAFRLFNIKSATVKSLARYGITGRVSHAELVDTWIDNNPDFSLVRETIIHADSVELLSGKQPALPSVHGDSVIFDRYFKEFQGDGERDFNEFYRDEEVYPSAFQPGRAWLISGMEASAFGTKKSVSELAIVDRVEPIFSQGQLWTQLFFTRPLAHAYERASVTLTPNVIRASHGETVGEILGSGDAGRLLQRFALRQPPLTYVGADTVSGGESTLRIQINGLTWQPADSLTEAGPSDRVYTLRNTDEGQSIVQFGDGKNGARPPSAANNIQALYRRGSGAAGNVRAGQLSLLISRPAGLKAVSNLLAASGGVDAEPRDEARRNAPVTTLTLDRVVSLRDYENFARAFAGIAKARAMEKPGGILLTVAGPDGSTFENDGQTLRHLGAALRRLGPPHVALEIAAFRPFTFELELRVRCAPEADRPATLDAVRTALLARFGFKSREFGEPVYASKVIRTAAAVPSVISVEIIRMHGEETKWNAEELLLLPPSIRNPVTRQFLPSGLLFLTGQKLLLTAA